MRKFTDEELRFTLHDAAPLPPGTVIKGSFNYDGAYTGRFTTQRWPTSDREWAAQHKQVWVSEPEPAPVPCECHEHMGNDFYFLPSGSCLRRDGKCTKGPKKGF